MVAGILGGGRWREAAAAAMILALGYSFARAHPNRLAGSAWVAVVLSWGLWKRKEDLVKDLEGIEFVPWTQVEAFASEMLVLDCTHSTLDCLTHHRMPSAAPAAIAGDTTSAMVLSAVKQGHKILSCHKKVSVNHFDIDAFISVWSACNPSLTKDFFDALLQAAAIGDFREFDQTQLGSDLGLKICCWINTMERRLFSRPFEDGDEDKWPYFMQEGRFLHFLRNPDEHEEEWKEEYSRVKSDLVSIEELGRIRCYDDISLCVVQVPEPIHYYALFSVSKGYDVVLSGYSRNRHEIEQKYTQFVNLASRRTLPRLELATLCKTLNELEEYAAKAAERRTIGAMRRRSAKKESQMTWKCERVVDTGPLLRLEDSESPEAMTRAQRYAHPYERDIQSSKIKLNSMERLLVSYMTHSYNGVTPKLRWTWNDIHHFNKSIRYDNWKVDFESLVTAAL
uniref:Uncharacterized protein n=1 Tax=Guillardia theta TaxID=55529 RepID=A0A7S4KEH4_GUITH|mmetsp:Transcript_23437/g.76177  ORF Transcript_23437/g.76177 Transcript_23437/m.76177 type:complete len:452 (+) Transcript_23437:86-1441(+)